MSQTLSLNDPVRIAGLDLPNRIIMAPLTRSRAGASGVPGPLAVEYYTQRASAGLIITEATNVGPLSCAFENAPGIWRADQVAGWRLVTEAVHGKGGHIFLQLWHGGRVSAKGLLDGQQPVSPSGVNDDLDALDVWAQLANGHYVKIKATPSRALSCGEVEAVVEQYLVGAANAKSAGFDGVESTPRTAICRTNFYLPPQTSERTATVAPSRTACASWKTSWTRHSPNFQGGSGCDCHLTRPTIMPWIRIRPRPTLMPQQCYRQGTSATFT